MNSQTEFKFGDRVKGIRGFYEGARGRIVDLHKNSLKYPNPTEYLVSLWMDNAAPGYRREAWILESDLVSAESELP